MNIGVHGAFLGYTGTAGVYNSINTGKINSGIFRDYSNTGAGGIVGEVYCGTLRSTVEFLQPSRKNKDKKTWKVDPMWQKFLHDTEKITLSDPERDLTLGRLLRWISVQVCGSLHLLDELGQARGFNIYQLIRDRKVGEYQKKQKRLLEDAKQMPDSLLKYYLRQFMEGYGENEDE